MNMEKQVVPGLRYTFLVHGVMMTIFALTYLFVPVLWGDLTGCLSNQVPQVFRIFGTAILGLAMTSLLAFRETSWDKVKIIAQMERILNILFPIVILLVLLLENLPKIGWMYFVIMSGFAIAFNVFYPRR
jgi:predicted permease